MDLGTPPQCKGASSIQVTTGHLILHLSASIEDFRVAPFVMQIHLGNLFVLWCQRRDQRPILEGGREREEWGAWRGVELKSHFTFTGAHRKNNNGLARLAFCR